MIVHHKTGEKISGLMSRQYRTAFNAGAGVTAAAGGTLGWWLVWSPSAWVVPLGVAGGAYLVNLRGRTARVKPYALRKPTKTTEDEILELQDIYFHMPPDHKAHIEKLLEGAYTQIERGNIEGVQPRLQEARDYRASVMKYIASSDTMSDVKEVRAAGKAMFKAIES